MHQKISLQAYPLCHALILFSHNRIVIFPGHPLSSKKGFISDLILGVHRSKRKKKTGLEIDPLLQQ